MNDDTPSSPLTWLAATAILGLAGWLAVSSLRDPSHESSANLPPLTKVSPLPDRPATADAGNDSASGPPAGAVPAPDPSTITDPILAMILSKLARPNAVANEALLTFRTKGELGQFLRQANGYGLKLLGTVDGLNTVRVGFDSPSALGDYFKQAGSQAPQLEPNEWFAVPRLPKEDYNNQNGHAPVGSAMLADINATGDRTTWGKGITVAVLDTGVKDHPTFDQGQITHVDLVNDGTPMHSHGTSVASLIAGQDDRVPGVAPAAQILDIRVASKDGYSVTSTLALGIMEAVNRGAQVVNISMGGYDDSALLRQAVAYAASKNVIVVAAAGNDGYDQIAYPAAIPGVIGVGSVDAQNKQAYFSNSGQGLDFVAPGVGLSVAWDIDKAAVASGTSQSSAVAAGVIAANLSLGVTPQIMEQRLKMDAKATGAPPVQVGNGVIQVAKH